MQQKMHFVIYNIVIIWYFKYIVTIFYYDETKLFDTVSVTSKYVRRMSIVKGKSGANYRSIKRNRQGNG